MSGTSKKNAVVIGVDFDNTLINYDFLIHDLAVEKGLITGDFPMQKKNISEHIRRVHGDLKWQEIQAIMYGERITSAQLTKGVPNFLEQCQKRHIPVYIVSHKTEYSNLLKGGSNFRKAALHWMAQQHFFTQYGLSVQNVFFESTRQEKVVRIQKIGRAHV